jgi:hypothetical protein
MTRMLLITAFLSTLCACGGDRRVPPSDSGGPVDSTTPTDTSAPVDAEIPTECGTDSPFALALCVDGAAYQTDLVLIAAPREPGSAHWQTVQDLCADRLASLGFTVERQSYGTGVNVVGTRTGTGATPRRVLVGAHYDSTPGCPGADDNATGTAAALEVARVLAMRDFEDTLVVACWDEEERGLIGSEAYATAARAAGEDIEVYFNFEMIGFVDDTPGAQTIPAGIDLLFPAANAELEANEFRGDFLALVGDESAGAAVESLERNGDLLGLPNIPLVVPQTLVSEPLLGDLRRSDHAPFWDLSYPAIMLTDTSEFRYDAYHCGGGPDVVENLDQAFTTLVIRTTVAAAAEALGP